MQERAKAIMIDGKVHMNYIIESVLTSMQVIFMEQYEN